MLISFESLPTGSAAIASFLADEEQFGLNSDGADMRSQNVLTFMAF